jgi:hypothetical protein
MSCTVDTIKKLSFSRQNEYPDFIRSDTQLLTVLKLDIKVDTIDPTEHLVT